jgi:hypothetical protein
MKKSLNMNDLEDLSNFKDKADRRQNIQVIGNQVVGLGQKERRLIVEAHHLLVKKGMARPNTSDPSTVTVAGLFLEAIGLTVLEKERKSQLQRDFSLLDKRRPDLDSGNPNIEDPNLKNLKNYQQEAKDVFTESSDPFYELDAGRSRQDKLQQRNFNKQNKKKAINSLARNLAHINLDNASPSLKYFQ